MKPVRTRFAPSPTGALHSGTVRTALFAWLFARHSGGQFLLRIEDTDQKREIEGAIDNIKQTLQWLGLDWDEGPDKDGSQGPYLQSERLEVYQQYAKELVEKGLAYADPYSSAELQTLREKAQAEKKPFLYREHRPDNPPVWDGSQPLRIKLQPKTWTWQDAVMGEVSMGPEMIDDYIIIKADGFPTYNFAHIVDDHLMEISHVLRSQEFLSSIPKFLATHETLGWESPVNATVPPVMDETGKRKLSKRHGAKPILEYRDQGFLPEAMLNFLATMGWNDGTEQEIFTPEELVAKFDLSRVQKSSAIFDEQRLLWLNGSHIRRLTLDELYNRCQPFWPDLGPTDEHPQGKLFSPEYRKQALSLVHERLKYLSELSGLTLFFFEDPFWRNENTKPFTNITQLAQVNKQLKKLSVDEIKAYLVNVAKTLEESDFSESDLEQKMRSLVEELDTKPGILFGLVRIAITGNNVAPGLFQTMHVLGKATALRRVKSAIA